MVVFEGRNDSGNEEFEGFDCKDDCEMEDGSFSINYLLEVFFY